jgi:hypothetical protein
LELEHLSSRLNTSSAGTMSDLGGSCPCNEDV